MKRPSSKKSRKEAILEAAIACFIEKGFAHTSMREVADKADVDQPLIHYYFPTLDHLYREVFLFVLETLKSAMLKPFEENDRDPESLIVKYVKASFDWVIHEPGLASIWSYFYYLASFKPEYAAMSTEIRKTGRERIAVLIYSGIEAGKFKLVPEMKVNEAATLIQGMITGNVVLFGTESVKNSALPELTAQGVLAILGVKYVRK